MMKLEKYETTYSKSLILENHKRKQYFEIDIDRDEDKVYLVSQDDDVNVIILVDKKTLKEFCKQVVQYLENNPSKE